MMLPVAERPQLPVKAALVTLLVCLLPWLLSALGGFDFGTPGEALDLEHWQTLPNLELTDRLHHALRGSFTHTLLEWSAFCTATLTAIFALIHYAFNRDVVTPIIGVVMFYAGCMDAFHTLAADRLIGGVADYQTLIPFTWALCRLFSALTIVLGAWFFLRRPQKSLQGGVSLIALASVVVGAIAYLTVRWCANTAALPRTLFPGALIVRPWDVYPLLVFVAGGLWVLPRFFRKYPSWFSLALLLSFVPQSLAQLHMAFGSDTLFDNDFNIAHFLKVVAYIVPFGGICCSYVQLYREKGEALVRLGQSLSEALGLNAILDNLADGLLVLDLGGYIRRINPAFLAMYGLAPGAPMLGRHCREIPLFNLPELVATALQSPTESTAAEVQLANDRAGQAIATGVFAPDDVDKAAPLGLAVLVRDITNEKEVDKMKTDFIATVSHELRTPLTSVLGFASIIQEKIAQEIRPQLPAEPPKLQRALNKVEANIQIIVTEAERLTALINDVLDIAKMEAGKIEWRDASVDVAEVLDRAIDATAALFAKSGLVLYREVDQPLPLVLADRDRLIQVVINLISNAVKFTPAGSIVCRVNERGGEVVVTVADTGIGIAAEDLPKVFDKFKQVGDTLTDKPKGTGLGLSICKQIVEHYRGRIWAESELGKGSQFCFALPALEGTLWQGTRCVDGLIDGLKRHVPEAAEPSSKSILVVDDDAHIRELLRQELEGEGYLVREAADGMAALRAVKDSKPDLVLMDVMMPQMSGFDTAAVLRNDPATADLPIALLSIILDRERGYRAGVDRYLTKPIQKARLLAEVEGLLDRGATGKKVLVVDRDASTVKVLSEVLRAQGYTVVEASNEQEALAQALTLQPDAIVIDARLSQESALVNVLRQDCKMENLVVAFVGERAVPSQPEP